MYMQLTYMYIPLSFLLRGLQLYGVYVCVCMNVCLYGIFTNSPQPLCNTYTHIPSPIPPPPPPPLHMYHSPHTTHLNVSLSPTPSFLHLHLPSSLPPPLPHLPTSLTPPLLLLFFLADTVLKSR